MAKRAVRSFDIFDTLVGRRVGRPTDVFTLVEANLGRDFARARLDAQAASNGTWAGIYDVLQARERLTPAERAAMEEAELAAEESVLFLVQRQYACVRDGDILVSDMYFEEAQIRRLLSSLGFARDVTIHVSPAGKASGHIWPRLLREYAIEEHAGDNEHSDVAVPRGLGIATRLVRDTRCSEVEELLLASGVAPALVHTLREYRASNPYRGGREWRLFAAQAEFNIPLLVLAAAQLRDFCQAESLQRILLSTRDGCLLEPILACLYPEYECVRFHTSRRAYEEPTPEYAEYVRTAYKPDKTIVFDMHGAFRTGRPLFQRLFGGLPRVHLLDLAPGRCDPYGGLTWSSVHSTPVLERLNLDVVGPLVSMDASGGDVRAPITNYDVDIAHAYKDCVASFVAFAQARADRVAALRQPGARLTEDQWTRLVSLIASKVLLDPDLAGIRDVEHESLTALANTLHTDKGTAYACRHGYTRHYERILQAFGSRIRLLEIGLNRSGPGGGIPSLRLWRKYLGVGATLHGMDIDPAFLQFASPTEGLHVHAGDQSNPADLARVAAVAGGAFDVVIDDGSHASAHQQISLRELWPHVRSGGCYVVEDLHYQPTREDERTVPTKSLLRAWQLGIAAASPVISAAAARTILESVSHIAFYDSQSPNPRWSPESLKGAFAVLWKRQQQKSAT